MKKTIKYYIGKVTEPENDDEEDGDYYVKFMKTPTTEVKFIWPTVTDKVWVHDSQILTFKNTTRKSQRFGVVF